MARLIVDPTAPSRREIEVPRSILCIGRDPSNDVVFADAMVSRRHAVLEYRGNRYYLRDCNSSNGSLVNGDRISERCLRDGDLVAIGSARMVFRDDAPPASADGKVVRHPSAPVRVCPQCEAEYAEADAFCRQCGGRLGQPAVRAKVVCTGCGGIVALPASFCNACGSTLPEAARPAEDPDAAPLPEPDPEPELEETREDGVAGDPAPPERALPAPDGPAADELPTVETSQDPVVALSPPSSAAPRPATSPVPPAGRASAAAAASPSPSAGVAPRPRAPRRPAPVPRPVVPPRHERASPDAELDRASPDAGLDHRALGGLLDLVAVGLAQSVLLAPVAVYWWSRELPVGPVPLALTLGVVIVAGLLGAGYFVYFWGVRGATPGKRLAGVAVEADDGSYPIGIPRALARLLGYLVSGALLGAGFAMILVDGRGLHDRLAGTRVVRRREG